MVRVANEMKPCGVKNLSSTTATIIADGFIQYKFDYSVFTKVHKGSIIILLVYVDDIFIASNNVDAVNTFKLFLDNKFKLKDLDTLKYFLRP